jgi:MarR family transcriptional regulator for hemolysin
MTDFDLNRSFGFVLHETARLFGKRFDQRAKALGLTRAQIQLLAYLLYHEGINQARLADMLEMEAISLARLIDRMEQAGWVERRPDPKDRRAWLLFVTEKLKPVFAKMVEIGKEVRAEALAGLSPAESEQAMALLLRVRRNLSDKGREDRYSEAAPVLAGAAE